MTIATDQHNTITLTVAARAKTQELATHDAHKEFSYLRVYLAGKGCDGFTYGVQFHHKTSQDVVFDQTSDPNHIPLICDKDSFEFLKGSTIDYVDDQRGQGYLVSNPHHRKYRGKFYKRKIWQDKLHKGAATAP